MRRCGFTLAELAMVAVVIAIVGALAAPRMARALARQRADAAARRVMVDLALAQREARAASATRTVSFDLANDRYTLTDVQDIKTRNQSYVVALAEEPYGARIMAAKFDGGTSLSFDGFGKAASNGKVIIAVGDHCREITVQADSGATASSSVSCSGVVTSEVGPDPVDGAADAGDGGESDGEDSGTPILGEESQSMTLDQTSTTKSTGKK
jgi:prepilin-type N-terminal cleavage/methylation domain-containing protein